MREERELILATKAFAHESPARSAFELVSTLAATFGAVLLTWFVRPWPLRTLASVFSALVLVRFFTLYHDHVHGAILKKSPIAKAIFHAYGWLAMTPPTIWRESHNYHHAHTAKLIGSHIGSFPMVTPGIWGIMSPAQRLGYRLVRHPLNIVVGYVTIFMFGMCIAPFSRSPRKYWDSMGSLVLVMSLNALLTYFFGWQTFFFVYGLPLALACMMGSYLFYIQHNFPGVFVNPHESWSYGQAALQSSSYMKTGPVMRWFTGNIGYHHVHHLNPQVPLYRLPEAMAAIPELQNPPYVTLSPRDIWRCLSLDLWDPSRGRMCRFSEIGSASQGAIEASGE